MRYIWIGMILCFLSVSLAVGCIKAEDQSDDDKNDAALQPAEQFVYHHLMSDQGLIKTSFSDQPVYLSESLGLWMEFLISKKDGEHFHEQYQRLTESFLMKNNLVSWQIQNGQPSGVNALIDDLRIMMSLDQAAALWGNSEYRQTALNIGAALKTHNMNNGILTDFYDSASQSASKDITLSYIMPDALSILKKTE